MKTLTLSAALLALLSTAAFAADPFTLTSSHLKDNTMMDAKHAGDIKTTPNCTGQNVSPQLTWKNTPAAAKSLVLVMSDWEGQSGLGSHQLPPHHTQHAVHRFFRRQGRDT